MTDPSKRKDLWVATGVVVAWLLPLMLFWYFIGRAPTVDPDQARELLSRPDSDYVLVDTRLPEDYRAGHIEGSMSWPYEQIIAVTAKEGIPETLRNKKIILVCDNGRFHHTKAVAEWLAAHRDQITIYWLPPYSPSLNLIRRMSATASSMRLIGTSPDLTRSTRWS
jgi:rhodanese-related sulfurtransferase